MARPSKQDAVLDAAEKLFERDGFVATGVNQITTEAGVASMTLYNNFSDKQELLVASIERRAERLGQKLENTMLTAGDDARGGIIAIFDGLGDLIEHDITHRGGFAGCYFLKASIEFVAQDHPAHVAAAHHKLKIIDLFEDATTRMGCRAPREVALKLQMLFDGAITQAQLLGDRDSAKRARQLAELLLANAEKTTAPRITQT